MGVGVRRRSVMEGRPALVQIIVFMTVTHTASARLCPQNRQDTVTVTSPEGQPLPAEVRGRRGKPLDLHCCTSEQNTVSWFRWMNNTWHEYPWYDNAFKTIYLLSNTWNQTLHFEDPYLTYDDGLYKCRVMHPANSRSVEHEMTVVLIDCANEAKPIPNPMLENTKVVSLGQNVTVLCQGYFGCLTNATSPREVYWKRGGMKLKDGTLPNYHVSNNQSLEQITMGSTLTIVNVKSADLKIPLDCVLDSGQTLKTEVWTLTLLKAPTGGFRYVLSTHWYIVMAVSVCVSIILVIVPGKLFGPQIHFFVKSNICRNLPVKMNKFTFDLVILYSLDGDSLAMHFAEKTLRTKLSKFGYACTSVNDSSPSSCILETSVESMRTSHCVAFIMTETSMDDQEFNYLVNTALQEKHNVFCVVVNSAEQKEPKLNEKTVTEKYNGLEIIKWPADNLSSSRKVNNCVSQIRLRLPRARVLSSAKIPLVDRFEIKP